MNLVSFFQQGFRRVRAILPCNASNLCLLHKSILGIALWGGLDVPHFTECQEPIDSAYHSKHAEELAMVGISPKYGSGPNEVFPICDILPGLEPTARVLVDKGILTEK